jgi:glycosyltransferase involved in cell wall biosynthesis
MMQGPMEQTPMRLVVLMPVYNDWQSAAELIRQVDAALSRLGRTAKVLVVDDASLQRCDAAQFQGPFTSVRAIQVLRLRRNLGHQRAIAIGLTHVQQTTTCDAVVVMDADGEDSAEGVVTLLNAYGDGRAGAVFAERIRRSESIAFQAFYQLYRFVHRALTGIAVRVGNFSVLPASYLGTIVVLPELWNHYAAALFRSKLPYTMTPIPRGRRIAGASKMNFVALATHGLSAISVFGDIVGVRLVIGSVAAALAAAIVVMAGSWGPALAGLLAIIMLQLVLTAASFAFLMLANRTNLGFMPLRDYAWFVSETVDVHGR